MDGFGLRRLHIPWVACQSNESEGRRLRMDHLHTRRRRRTGPEVPPSAHHAPTLAALLHSSRFDVFHHLCHDGPPSILESHLLVTLARFIVAVDGDSLVMRAVSFFCEFKNCRKEGAWRRAIAAE